MKVYGIFFGGANYSTYVTNSDVEEFPSLQRAKETFETRVEFDRHYPCCDESASMWIFYDDPRNSDVDINSIIDTGYPDRIIELGARGGVIV